ncbi:MAG: hypothetical protein ACI865_002430 [Flavobacteriaceae bacterium]|jgi:hypothetical protein
MYTVEIDNNTHKIEHSISSVEGKLVQDLRSINAKSISIDLSNESKGVYLLKMSLDGASNVIKLILE